MIHAIYFSLLPLLRFNACSALFKTYSENASCRIASTISYYAANKRYHLNSENPNILSSLKEKPYIKNSLNRIVFCILENICYPFITKELNGKSEASNHNAS